MRPRIAAVTCYKHPDYIRALTLRTALSDLGCDVTVVKNESRGIRRYLEVAQQLWSLRQTRPDAYLVTFRGYEIMPVVLALAGGKPVIYDEFINPLEWFVEEHKKFAARSVPARVLRSVFRSIMRRSAVVLTDTESHADHSAALMDVEREHFVTVPVGTDEATFASIAHTGSAAGIRVLYYGSMLPLHGLDVVLDAAVSLASSSGITFHIVGGDDTTAASVAAAKSREAHIEWDRWVPYEQLPALFAASDVFVGGPLGGTVQADMVITGKTYQFLSAGLPTIVGHNRESGVFVDRVNALVVPQADPEAFAAACTWALEHRSELAAIGLAGKALYGERWSPSRVAAALAPALGRALGHGEHGFHTGKA